MMTADQVCHHCLSKAAFPTRGEALRHVYQTMLDARKCWTHKRVYECKFGRHYHVGRGLNPINVA